MGGEKKQLESISLRLKFPEKQKGEQKKEKRPKFLFAKDIEQIGSDFTALMQMLNQYMNEIGSVAEHTARTNVFNIIPFIRELSEEEKSTDEDEKPVAEVEFEINFKSGEEEVKNLIIESNIYKHEYIEKVIEFQNQHDASLRILNETGIQQIVNAYEKLIGDIIEWQLYNKPDKALDSEHISYRSLLNFNSLEEAKKYVIDDVITEFLKNKSAKEQLKYFKDEFGISIKSLFPKTNLFEELVLRRHCIVHTGGIATSEYIQRAKGINGVSTEGIEVGQKIPLKSEYVANAWRIVYALGIILFHQVGQNYARSTKNKEKEKSIDFYLIESAYNAIENKAYKAAQYILEYANKIKLSGDSAKYYVILNLAQAYLWQGKKDKCNELLDKHDWSCLSGKFQLSVAALRNQEEKFRELLTLVVKQQDIKVQELLEWPIFKLMRKKDGYKDWIEEEFEEEIQEMIDLLPSKMLDFDNENIKRLEGFLKAEEKNG